MCRFAMPPGYTRTKPATKPKPGSLLPVIERCPDELHGVEAATLEELDARLEQRCRDGQGERAGRHAETIGERLVAISRLFEREADLLPVGYFHVVFTLPVVVAHIALQNKPAVYGLLFQPASETMTTTAGTRSIAVPISASPRSFTHGDRR